MLRFVLLVLLCFVCGRGAVACHGLLCFVRRRRKLTHVTVCFVLLCSGLFCLHRARGQLSHVTILFALLCFTSLCITLLRFALHCSFVECQKSKTNTCYKARQKQAKSKQTTSESKQRQAKNNAT